MADHPLQVDPPRRRRDPVEPAQHEHDVVQVARTPVALVAGVDGDPLAEAFEGVGHRAREVRVAPALPASARRGRDVHGPAQRRRPFSYGGPQRPYEGARGQGRDVQRLVVGARRDGAVLPAATDDLEARAGPGLLGSARRLRPPLLEGADAVGGGVEPRQLTGLEHQRRPGHDHRRATTVRGHPDTELDLGQRVADPDVEAAQADQLRAPDRHHGRQRGGYLPRVEGLGVGHRMTGQERLGVGAARPEHRAGTDDQPRPVDHQRLGDGDVVVGQGRRQAVERVARRVGRGTREDHHLPAGLRDPEVGADGRTDPGERREQTRVRVRREQHRERELDGPRQPGTHHDQLEVGALAAPGHRPGHPAHRAVEVGRRVQHDADPPRLARPVLRGRPVDEVALQDRRRPAGVVVRRVRRAVEQHPGHERHRRRRGQLDQQVQGLGPAERLVEPADLGHHLAAGRRTRPGRRARARAGGRGRRRRPGTTRRRVAASASRHAPSGRRPPPGGRASPPGSRGARCGRGRRTRRTSPARGPGPRCAPGPGRPAAPTSAPRAARTWRCRPAPRSCRRPSRRRRRPAPSRRTTGPGPCPRRRAAAARRR